MSARASKIIAGMVLAIAIGVQLLEVSGRWDRTFQDANDEAVLVAVVLCVGLALTTAATRCARLLAATPRRFHPFLVPAKTSRDTAAPRMVSCRGSSPPSTLRI
jgi:hypothetical protein